MSMHYTVAYIYDKKKLSSMGNVQVCTNFPNRKGRCDCEVADCDLVIADEGDYCVHELIRRVG